MLTPVSTEVLVVKKIFDRYTTAMIGSRAIANELNAQGHRTKQGKPWSGQSVLVVVRNRVYL
ncbi:MAG: site-specific recombinase, partial [Mycobacterium sp.]|nr:site-specific recombinase [Mycobacterium sp.]